MTKKMLRCSCCLAAAPMLCAQTFPSPKRAAQGGRQELRKSCVVQLERPRTLGAKDIRIMWHVHYDILPELQTSLCLTHLRDSSALLSLDLSDIQLNYIVHTFFLNDSPYGPCNIIARKTTILTLQPTEYMNITIRHNFCAIIDTRTLCGARAYTYHVYSFKRISKEEWNATQ